MINKIHKIMQNMIEFSKKKTNHPGFIKSVQELLSNELDFPESLFIFSVGDYFLKSSYKHYRKSIGKFAQMNSVMMTDFND